MNLSSPELDKHRSVCVGDMGFTDVDFNEAVKELKQRGNASNNRNIHVLLGETSFIV